MADDTGGAEISVEQEMFNNLDALMGDDGQFQPLPEDDGDVSDNQLPAGLSDPYREAAREAAPEAEEGGEEGEEEEPLAARAEPPPKKEEPSTAGSEEDPYTIDDFADDEFIQVKINGADQTLKVKDAVQNGMMKRDFDQRAHRLRGMLEETQGLADQAQARVRSLEQGLSNTLSSPKALRAYLDQHFPEVLDQLALDYYPTLYERHERGELEQYTQSRALQRDRRLAEGEQQKLRDQHARIQQQQRSQQRRAVALPAVHKALEQAGFPKLSPELRRDVGAALDVKEHAVGRPLTAEEITETAARWLRAYASSDAAAPARKPRHVRGRAAPRAVQASPRRSNGGTPTKGMYDAFGGVSTDWILGNG